MTLQVVGGLAVDERGRVLMGKRPPDKRRGELWEYPGGKVEDHEIAADALCREWREELGVGIDVREHLGTVYLDLEVPFEWSLYVVRPTPFTWPAFALNAHTAIDWVDPRHAIEYMPCTPTTYEIWPQVREYLRQLVR